MYHHSPNLVLGFHGCTKKVFKKILFHHEELEFSNNSYDWLIRELDCAVIERIHLYNHMTDGNDEYDSVRGAFIEGKPVYPGSGFRDRTHIQICVRNPNCIKGYFAPKIENENYSSV